MNKKKMSVPLAALLAGLAGCSDGNKNDAPTASGASVTINEDAPATTISVTNADRDNDPLTVVIVNAPTRGTVAVTGSSSFSYTPNANQNGTDQFTYQVTDPDGLSATGTVNITLAAQNDLPQVQGGNINTDEDVAGSLVVTATDIDGDTLTPSVSTQPGFGTVAVSGTNPFTFRYTPASNRNGNDAFSIRVQDPAGGTATANVTVTVTAQPDAPVVPVLTVTVPEDGSTNGAFGATDPDGDNVTLSVVTQPSHGTLVVAGDGYTYTPGADYFGPDSFSVSASDGSLQSAALVVPVTVSPVNDLPVAQDDVATVAATGPTDVDVTANDSDVEDAALTVEIVTPPPGASATVVNGEIRITPAAGARGPTSLSYRVRDSDGATASANVRLVMGDTPPLFLMSSTVANNRVYRYDYFSQALDLALPVPAGETLERFTTSANGARLVYATRVNSLPPVHRLWLKNLDDLSAPVVEISTGPNYYTRFLELSPDGATVVFNDRYAQTSGPGSSNPVEPGAIIEYPLFTRDSQYVFYTVVLPGGGRVIKRAQVTPTGALGNYLQMTASYATAEGLGLRFVLTPDETKIVSTGLFIAGPPISSIKQEAYVTTADGSRDDTRLHPPYVHPVDYASLPIITPDSRYGFYFYIVNAVYHTAWADLQSPGTNIISSNTQSSEPSRVAGNSRTGFNRGYSVPFPTWPFFSINPSESHGLFQPLGGGTAAPREVMPAPDGSAVVFDSGAGIYATLGDQFTQPTLLFTRWADVAPMIAYAPDSGSVAVANISLVGTYVANPKAPGWWEELLSGGTLGATCLAYAGDGC